MVERLSVRLSVRLSRRSTAAAACGGFAAERRPAGRRHRTIAGDGAQQQMRQCRVNSRGTTLNTDT